MEEKRIYLLAQFDADANNRMADIYWQIALAGFESEQSVGIPHHITLGSFDVAYESEIIERVRRVCAATKAFDVNMNHIGLFGQRVLFIAPSMNGELLKLHDELIPEEPASGAHSWVAHATVLIDDSGGVQAAMPILAQSFSPFTARIECVGIYEFFPSRFIGEVRLAT